jgi:hypothetical protein
MQGIEGTGAHGDLLLVNDKGGTKGKATKCQMGLGATHAQGWGASRVPGGGAFGLGHMELEPRGDKSLKNNIFSRQVIDTGDMTYDQVKALLDASAHNVGAMDWSKYDLPVGIGQGNPQNSDNVLWELIYGMGIDPPAPPFGIWAPGYGPYTPSPVIIPDIESTKIRAGMS